MIAPVARTRPASSRAVQPAARDDPALARMLGLVRAHWRLNRTAVNPDTDLLVESIRKRLHCPVREFAAGSEVLTWIVPRRWHVRNAWLAREEGGRILDFADNPLHLWTHSVAFDGTISRAGLEPHLHHDPAAPDHVFYHFINGYRYTDQPAGWGFSLPHRQYARLGKGRFHVYIDADLDHAGTMKVIDQHLPGEVPDTIFFAAHTCHPGQVTDGLSNVAVLVELFDRLAQRPHRKYSYRLILGPEYFAAAAFLATTPARELECLRGGVYVDMIGNGQPLGFSTSYQGDAAIDRVVANVVRHHTPRHAQFAHRKLAGNDEMFYNGPGFGIPTVELGCAPSPEHHTDADNFDRLDAAQMLDALGVLERIIDVFETDFVPVRKFRGPLYLSRYGLYTPLQEDERWHDVQEGIQILMDARRSCFDIAHELNADYEKVRVFCVALQRHDLIGRVAQPPQAGGEREDRGASG